MKKYNLKQLAEFLSADFKGDPDCIITGIGSLYNATLGQISFLNDAKYKKHLDDTKAAVVIIKPELCDLYTGNVIICSDPYLAYAKISLLYDDRPTVASGIHPSAIIDQDCSIDSTVSIGPACVIGKRVKIGAGSQIHTGCVIGDDAQIGENAIIYPKVVLYHKVKLGNNVAIHSGAVIGADGFGNANEKGVWRKIYQLGGVVIGNDVEIGANTTVDRGAIEDTIIEDGVKLDNQIQIGHNVHIGAHTAIAGCTGIAGSTKIGRHCMIGGGVGINGHIEITNGVIISGKSAVGKSITKPGIYASSIPAMPYQTWGRVLVKLAQLVEKRKT